MKPYFHSVGARVSRDAVYLDARDTSVEKRFSIGLEKSWIWTLSGHIPSWRSKKKSFTIEVDGVPYKALSDWVRLAPMPQSSVFGKDALNIKKGEGDKIEAGNAKFSRSSPSATASPTQKNLSLPIEENSNHVELSTEMGT